MTKVYQKNLVTSLIPQWKIYMSKDFRYFMFNENSDPIEIALNKYVNHPSIFKIKEYFNKPTECNFLEVTPDNI